MKAELVLREEHLKDLSALEKAQTIPGAHLSFDGRIFWGAHDAVAAVAGVLEKQMPRVVPRKGGNVTPHLLKAAQLLKLREYQLAGCAWLSELLIREGGALLADDMGCISGDEEVLVQRYNATRRMKLSQLFEKFHRLGGEWRCRSLADGRFQQRRIVDVLEKGIRQCVWLELASGKHLTCTPDHEVLTTDGWVRADQLLPTHDILTNGYNQGSSNSNWKGGRVLDKSGYVLVHAPEHPRAVQGKVREHRLVMEAHLGRLLRSNEVVHHLNKKKTDNRIENLEVLTKKEHAKEHASENWARLDGGRTVNGGEVIILPRLDKMVRRTAVGPRLVYDIKMKGPHHNFVANRVVVHNCGKTRQAAALAIALNKRTLVICPAAVREQWLAEFAPSGLSTTALGPPSYDTKKTRAAWEGAEDAQVVITSFNLCEEAFAAMGKKKPQMLIIDEAHNIKGRPKRGKDGWLKAVRTCAQQARFRLALTGTPMQTRPRDFWTLLDILFHGVFGTAYQFDVRYCGGVQGQHGFENKGATNLDELRYRVAQYMVRREKKDVLTELPPLSRTIRWVDPDTEAKAAFDASLLTRESGGATAALQATLEGKLPAAVEACIEAQKFVCLTWLKAHAARLTEELTEAGLDVECITGDTSVAQRRAVIANARARGASVVGTIDSLKEGVDGLQGLAHQGIMHTLDWQPMKLMQAEARIHRMGQQMPVTWTYIAMRDTMDEVVVQKVVSRLETWAKAMGAKNDGSMEMRDDLSDSRSAEVLNSLFDSMGDLNG